MTKCIGFAVALVAALGVTLATPSSSEACHRGYGYYGGYCCYSAPVCCSWTNYCCYRPVVSCCQTIYYSVPGCSYCYNTPGIVGMPVAQNNFSVMPQVASNNTVQIHVGVPAGAKVWFNNTATQQEGTDRLFTSPPLTPGFDYTYDVKAQWVDASGKEVTQVRQVTMRANTQVDVNFVQATR